MLWRPCQTNCPAWALIFAPESHIAPEIRTSQKRPSHVQTHVHMYTDIIYCKGLADNECTDGPLTCLTLSIYYIASYPLEYQWFRFMRRRVTSNPVEFATQPCKFIHFLSASIRYPSVLLTHVARHFHPSRCRQNTSTEGIRHVRVYILRN